MRTGDKAIRFAILALIFTSGVFVAHQNDLAVMLAKSGVGDILRPFSVQVRKAPLYIGARRSAAIDPFPPGQAVIEVISANRTTRLDRIVVSGTYTAGTTALPEGMEIYLHVYSSVRVYEYYDEWYHATVGEGESVRRLRPGLCLGLCLGLGTGGVPIGQFDEENSGSMTLYSTGGVFYWRVTPLFVLQWRDDTGGEAAVGKGGLVFNLENPDGRMIRSATGLSPASGSPDSAPADFIATTARFSFELNVIPGDPGRVYGHPMLFLGPPPNYEWQIGYLVIWISFNNTGIGVEYLTSNGWTLLPPNLTPGYMNFYKVLPPITGSSDFVTIDIHVDTSSLKAGTAISLRVWIADLQTPADAARGIDDSVPTPYGIVASYGIRSTIFANGFRTSSNRPVSQLIWGVFKSG